MGDEKSLGCDDGTVMPRAENGEVVCEDTGYALVSFDLAHPWAGDDGKVPHGPWASLCDAG